MGKPKEVYTGKLDGFLGGAGLRSGGEIDMHWIGEEENLRKNCGGTAIWNFKPQRMNEEKLGKKQEI